MNEGLMVLIGLWIWMLGLGFVVAWWNVNVRRCERDERCAELEYGSTPRSVGFGK